MRSDWKFSGSKREWGILKLLAFLALAVVAGVTWSIWFAVLSADVAAYWLYVGLRAWNHDDE